MPASCRAVHRTALLLGLLDVYQIDILVRERSLLQEGFNSRIVEALRRLRGRGGGPRSVALLLRNGPFETLARGLNSLLLLHKLHELLLPLLADRRLLEATFSALAGSSALRVSGLALLRRGVLDGLSLHRAGAFQVFMHGLLDFFEERVTLEEAHDLLYLRL